MSGYMPAHITAITVIASAARLKLERYLERNRNNTAEISVPECAIPTQKTKLMMSNAQPTGFCRPNRPIPFQISAAQVPRSSTAKMVANSPTRPQYMRPGFCIAMMTSRSIWRRAIAAGCEEAEVATALCSMFRASILLQIEHARAGAELFQNARGARIARPLVDLGVLIQQIAEHDGLAGARLRARGGEITFVDLATLVLGDVARVTDTLHAERALLHDALAANRDIRIDHEVERMLAVLPRVPVEATLLVRTVVGTVARADATVVDLCVQALVVVIRREHRTHRF